MPHIVIWAGRTKTGMFTKAEAIESFLAKYKVPEPPTPEQQQGDGEEYKFDFAPYPKLLSSLRLVEAFGADSVATVLPGEDARTILRSLGPQRGGSLTGGSLTKEYYLRAVEICKCALQGQNYH